MFRSCFAWLCCRNKDNDNKIEEVEMEEVPHIIEDDMPPPPPPPREYLDVIPDDTVSCHSIENRSQDGAEAESSSGYLCRTSFERSVFIRDDGSKYQKRTGLIDSDSAYCSKGQIRDWAVRNFPQKSNESGYEMPVGTKDMSLPRCLSEVVTHSTRRMMSAQHIEPIFQQGTHASGEKSPKEESHTCNEECHYLRRTESEELIMRWKSLPRAERTKTIERLRREVCQTCAEVCPRRGYGHYCLQKGAGHLESASLLDDCSYCKESFTCGEQMFLHSLLKHLGILAWVCPLCVRAFHNRYSYRRHIVWGHGGIKAFMERIKKEFGSVLPVMGK